ncbi:hypothetical protein M2427_000825 [Bradyrhizobium sp. BR13661]|nr:hypothetical protein [Bradyrhizobium sp. BR13661]
MLRCARNDGVLGDDVTLKTNISNRRHTFSPSRLISPELCFISPPSQSGGRREDRVLTSHPRSAARKCSAGKPHSSIQVWPNTRPSLRDGLTAYAVLSREPNSFWPPSPRELTMHFTRLGSLHLRDRLDRSDDGQDHTVLPYARSPHATGFSRAVDVAEKCWQDELHSAVHPHAVSDSQGLPALPAPLVPTLPRPPQARLANVTTYDRPSRSSRDGRNIRYFRISVKWNIFSCAD